MRRRLIAVIGCVAGLAAGTAWTQCLEHVAEVTHDIAGQPPSIGSASAVAVSGSYAYYNVGPVLHVVWVAAPDEPQAMGELTLRGRMNAIAINGPIAYVAMGSAGLSVVDISNPWAPEERSFIDTTSASLDVAVSGGYLYVADGWAGLGVFDLADPVHPVLVSRFAMSAGAIAVAIGRSEECSYAVVTQHSGIRVIDVSDPRMPIEVGHYGSYGVADVAISGGYAFVSDADPLLHVIDVSTPSMPVPVGEVSRDYGWFLAPSLAVSPSHAYLGRFPQIIAVDVNPPTEPENECELPWDYPTGRIVWAGGYLYVPIVDVWSQRAGLAILRDRDGAPADFGSIECVEPPVLFESFIPAAAVASGAAGAFFQTDVEVSNTGEGDAEVSFDWLPRGQDNPNPLRSGSYVLAPGESRRFENVLTEVFGLAPDSVGALRLVSTSESVIGMSRTYSIPAGDGAGTYGQSLPAVPAAAMIPSGERRRIMFMSEDVDSRANLGCVNGADRPLQVSIGIYDDAGTELDTRTMDLGPYANNQINRVLQPWEPVQGCVDVWSDTEGAFFYCYGSVLDNLTSDPTTVLPQ